VAERKKNGRFSDLFDFCERVEAGACNRSTIETLIKAGGLDSLGGNRNQLTEVIDRAMQSGSNALADRKRGQKSLFDDEEDETGEPLKVQYPDHPEWEEREKLAKEKEVLGFYLSSHPLAEYEEKLKNFCSHTVTQLATLANRQEVLIGGMISSIKTSHTRNPKPGQPSKFANFDLEDMSLAIRCICWPDDYVAYEELIEQDAVLVARGVVDKSRGDEPNLVVNELIRINDLDAKYTTGIRIRLDVEKQGLAILPRFREVLRGYPGRCNLEIVVAMTDGSSVRLKSQNTSVDITPQLRTRIDDLLGPGNYRLLTEPPKPKPPTAGGGRRRS
jgi:DNA polymerase-3 subunit alpha